MNRRVFISDKVISLTEYIPEKDNLDYYTCWQDRAVQDGYNYKMQDTFEEFCKRPVRSRLLAVIVRNEDSKPLGIVTLSPESTEPDLAIILYKPYRGKGYGTGAFTLAARYCIEKFGLEHLYAGCYEPNIISRKMLMTCGFVPYPQEDSHELHYLTGEPIIQRSYVYRKTE